MVHVSIRIRMIIVVQKENVIIPIPWSKIFMAKRVTPIRDEKRGYARWPSVPVKSYVMVIVCETRIPIRIIAEPKENATAVIPKAGITAEKNAEHIQRVSEANVNVMPDILIVVILIIMKN